MWHTVNVSSLAGIDNGLGRLVIDHVVLDASAEAIFAGLDAGSPINN